VSARVGTRRLLIVLSALYWIGALIASFALLVEENDHIMAILHPDPMRQAEFLKAFNIARAQGIEAFWAGMALCLILFGLIWGVFFTVRWIIRGYRVPR